MQIKNQQGYSVIEWMISIVIGLFITAGITSLFVAGQRNTNDTFHFGEMQEQGRLAIEVLSNDIRHAGFFGDFTGNVMKASPVLVTPTQPAKQCLDDKNTETFPTASREFRSIWAMNVSSSGTVSSMGCVLDTVSNTELTPSAAVLSVKRVIGQPIACTDADNGRYYFAANGNNAEIVTGSDVSTGCSSLEARLLSMRLWEYQHHVYYLDRLDNGDGTVTPQLRKMKLMASSLGNGMYRDSGAMVQGIEDIQYLFGIDDSGDGEVNRFVPQSAVNDGDWDQNLIVAVQLFLLVRAREPSKPPYKNSASYQLGDRTVVVDDRYRRLLLTAIVPIRNQVLINAG